jgi:hypothetical protein
MEISDEFCPIYGSRPWDLLDQAQRDELGWRCATTTRS